MIGLLGKVLRNLQRPLPDLYGFAVGKLLSLIWARYLAEAGPRFHVSRGTRIQGASAVRIGNGFYAGPSLWIEAVRQYLDFRYEPSIVIGANVICSDFVHIAATTSVTIGDGVLMGSGVHITDHAHGVYSGASQDSPETPPAKRRLMQGKAVRIGTNVWLGDGVVVLPGVSIGAGSIVGANSVVSRDLPANVIAVGAPAVPIKAYHAASASWVAIENRP